MAAASRLPAVPQDVVAIFHAAFHPTKGNVVDWTLKVDDNLSLEGVEFSCLPSGLHLLEHDVVYFDKDGHQGVCIFRRRPTTEEGHRNYRLSSIGILLAKSRRPRAWRHVDALKQVTQRVYELGVNEGRRNLELGEKDWEPARLFFEERKVRSPELDGAGSWFGWLDEFNNGDPELANPALHIPHLLRILGPSCLTLYKHVLARRRILIYTLPPVEAACILSYVAADLCQFQNSEGSESAVDPTSNYDARGRGKSKDPIQVLGMVTLNDIQKMTRLGQTGNGWIACTTDALFMERPSYYDLLIDLTTSTPNKASRPTLYVSKAISPPPPRGQTHRLSTIRFVWSDVKLWNELSRLLDLSPDHGHGYDHTSSYQHTQPSGSRPGWTDVWRIYEDVCVICAGLWMGSWRGNSKASYSTLDTDGTSRKWGAVRLEEDDDLSLDSAYVRPLGRGIEGGRRDVGSSLSGKGKQKAIGEPLTMKRRTAPSAAPYRESSDDTRRGSNGNHIINTQPSKQRDASTADTATLVPDTASPKLDDVQDDDVDADADMAAEAARERSNRAVQITLLILQTFDIHTSFLLSRLSSFLPSSPVVRGAPIHELHATSTRDTSATVVGTSAPSVLERDMEVVYLRPRDVLVFELGPLSELDALFVEWLADVYGGGRVKFVVKRSWRDFLGLMMGFS